MNITQYTARKQIAFTLPAEAAASLFAMENRMGSALRSVPLKTNICRLDNVSYMEFGTSRSPAIYVDFDMGAGEVDPSTDDAVMVIAAYAEAAEALKRFIPGIFEADDYDFLAGSEGTPARTVDERPRSLLHIDRHFVVMAPTGGSEVSVHFHREGRPCAIRLDTTPAIDTVFAAAAQDTGFSDPGQPVLPTRHLETVREWVRDRVFIAGLEAEMSYAHLDLDAHPLRHALEGEAADVAYIDNDVIVERLGDEFLVHFAENGLPCHRLVSAGASAQFADLCASAAFLPHDDVNPVRTWLRERMSFDVMTAEMPQLRM